MTLAHLHLLLNHVPTVGAALAITLLILAIIRRSDALKLASLEISCVIALLTLPAYLSGVGTQRALEEVPGVLPAAMARHHDAALVAALAMVFTGAAAWLALWQFRRLSRTTPFATAAVLALSVLTLVLMARAANLGGEIRHPEILSAVQAAAEPEAAAAEAPGWLTAAFVASLITDRVWLWPAAETLHFIGLWLLLGVMLPVNLRMLGMMKQASFAALHRLLPWAVLGLLMNTITGMAFVIGTPNQYAENVSFFWKIGLLLLAGANLLYFTAFEGPWSVRAGERAPLRVKVMAATSMGLWVGVMYFGRMLPFIGNAF